MKSTLASWTALTLAAACAPKSVDLGAGPNGAGEAGMETGARGGSGNAANGGSVAANGGSGNAANSGGRGSVAGTGGAAAGRGNVGGTSAAESTCGDGIVDAGELCDDGNRLSGDGCGADCMTLEPGYVCITGTCGWLCGNTLVSSPDQCAAGSCTESKVAPPPPAGTGDDRRPCDIYAEDGGPCVAAHSTVRALYAQFDGPLYAVRRTDGALQNIGPLEPGGFADSARQDDFCGGDECTIAAIYDQSGHGNHLIKAPPGGAKPTPGTEALATAVAATFGGHKLYAVRRTDGALQNIGPLEPGGFADSARQDDFCGGDECTIAAIYDQSGHGNHLIKAPPGGANPTPGTEALATAVAATFGGHKVYGVHVVPGVGYRNNNACGTAAGDDAETIYMIVSGTFQNAGCCFDYGNMERDSRNNGEGTAEAVYFGTNTTWGKGNGSGPWVMADLENGLWAGDRSPYAQNLPLDFKYVTGMVKGDAAGQNHWTIKSGNAQSGELTTPFDGARPSARYAPMRKEGGIGLGTAGDNSNTGQGDFFEGVMTAHYSTDAADSAVQANVVSVYGNE